MVRPVNTCWNMMCGVIEHVLYLWPALDTMLLSTKYVKGKGKLSHLKLTAIEWDLVSLLLPMLKVISVLFVFQSSLLMF